MRKVAIFISLFFFGLSLWSCESVNYVKNELSGIGKPEGGSEEVVPNISNQDDIYKIQKRLTELVPCPINFSLHIGNSKQLNIISI